MPTRERTRIQNPMTMSQRVAGGWGMLLFSLPFLGIGIFLSLTGFELVPIELEGANAPLWVIGAVGLAFALAGLVVFVNAARGLVHQGRVRERERLHRGRPWMIDYEWDEQGSREAVGRKVGGALLGVMLFGVFLAPFNWWAWGSGQDSLFVQIIVSVFDLIMLLVIWNAVKHMIHALKYGGSYLAFESFPNRLGEELRVRFGPNRFDRVRFTLRCVEEYWETRRCGRERSKSLVSDQVYADVLEIETSTTTSELDVHFTLPDDPELTTHLAGAPVRYWQLRAQAEAPGLDLDVALLVPVYANERSRGSRLEPIATT